MVKVFVDTNILIDFLNSSRGGHGVALDLFNIILSNKAEAAITTQSILDAAYVCAKEDGFNNEKFRETVTMLVGRTNIGFIDSFDIREAFGNPDPDIEDNAQISFAYNQVCDVFLTNDRKILSRKLPEPMIAMTPSDFVDRCKQ